MRISPPLAILALISVSLISLALDHQYRMQEEQKQVRSDQCEVAVAYLKELRRHPRKPWLLVERPEQVSPLEDIKLFLYQNPNLKNDPDVAIEVQKAKTAGLSPVKLCPMVAKWARDNRVRVEPGPALHKDAPTPDWQVPNKNDEYDWHVIRISMPVISADRNTAYFNASEYFGPLGGGGDAFEYKKLSDGRWKLYSRVGLYIS